MLKIKNINEDLNTILPEEEVYRNLSWKLKRLEFSNMFSYGEDNVVDFTKINGIVGMFAPNATGKSSLLDALSFALYDTCSRAFKAENVLNNRKKDFFCKVMFEIDGQEYVVERLAKKQRKGNVKVDVDFYTFDDTGEKVSMNGDQRRTTNINIKKVIGTYEDFILTALSSQNNNSVFIEKTQKEKKTLLAQFMGLEVFDKLWQAASEEIKDVAAVLRNFKKNDWELELSEIKDKKGEFKLQQKSLNNKKDEMLSQKKMIESQIRTLTKKLKPTDKSIQDIDSLKQNKDVLGTTLHNIDIQLGEVVTRKEKANTLNIQLKHKLNYHKEAKTEENFMNLQKLDTDKREAEFDLDKLKIEVKTKLDKIDKLGNLEYDENCDYCMSNSFTLDAIETQKSVDEDKEKVKESLVRLDTISEKISNLNHTQDRKKDLDDTINKLQKVAGLINDTNSNEVILEEKRKNVLHQITSIEEKVVKYYEQEQDIMFNQQIESEIKKVEDDLEELNNQLDSVTDGINNIFGEIKVVDTKRKTIMDNIKKVEELEDKYEAYQYYLDAVKRDGVPYELITKALPTIEGEVNNILSQLVDFSMTFEMDGKNINNYIVYDDDNVWPLELSSGMEKFISSLAIRVGLINVSSLPRSNFLAIDEGFGTMDSDNLNSIYNLFQYLKSQFQFTLIVSHIDSMRDAVDTLLEVKKENGFSNINFD